MYDGCGPEYLMFYACLIGSFLVMFLLYLLIRWEREDIPHE